jgi:hypothetical protein
LCVVKDTQAAFSVDSSSAVVWNLNVQTVALLVKVVCRVVFKANETRLLSTIVGWVM